MPYEICILHKGHHFFDDEVDDLEAKCTCVLIKGDTNVVVNTLSCWDDDVIIGGMVAFGVSREDIAYVVSTNGGSSYIGNNHIFVNSIHIVGHSIQEKNVFLPEPFSEGKPYFIDGDDLKVIPTPGRTLDDVSVIVKTKKDGIVAITGDLFIKEDDIQDDKSWLTTRSECPIIQRYNRQIILSMVDSIIPGYGLMFEVTEEMRNSHKKHRTPFEIKAKVIGKVGAS